MTSTRLPGKVMLSLRGRTVIAEVITRCAAVAGVDAVICALPVGAIHDAIGKEAAACGALVTRGSETDVLARYHSAACEHGITTIIRVTSDCPLIDPALCALALDVFKRVKPSLVCNDLVHSWPVGLGCEVFDADWLAYAAREATRPGDREHVSPFILEHPEAQIVGLVNPEGDFGRHRWTLDTPADYRFLTELCARMPDGPQSWDHHVPLRLVEADLALAAINRDA